VWTVSEWSVYVTDLQILTSVLKWTKADVIRSVWIQGEVTSASVAKDSLSTYWTTKLAEVFLLTSVYILWASLFSIRQLGRQGTDYIVGHKNTPYFLS